LIGNDEPRVVGRFLNPAYLRGFVGKNVVDSFIDYFVAFSYGTSAVPLIQPRIETLHRHVIIRRDSFPTGDIPGKTRVNL
jgi:hypothetical protein